MQLSIKPKIKIRIKMKQSPESVPEPALAPKSATAAAAAAAAAVDIFDLMRECRRRQINVRGNRETLQRILANGCRYRPKDDASSYVGALFVRHFLYKLGAGPQASQANNTTDFYTDWSISRIPKVYLYCIKDMEHIYAFDIRSLNGYYQEMSSTRQATVNPYTMQPLTETHICAMIRKLMWLQRLGFHTLHLTSNRTLPLDKQTERYAVDVFHKIAMYQYVSHTWFMDLSTRELQKLYHELWDLWTYRLSLTVTEARKITKTGALFTNLHNVKKYTSSMKDVLRCELLKNIEKLVTEGQTEEDKKTGSLYFMLGFVQVSQDAADHHPSLFNAVYSEES
jgi:hypothetical protein